MKGFTTLTLEGHANSFLLNKRMKSNCWTNKARSEVVEEIARENGYESQFLHIVKRMANARFKKRPKGQP